MPRLPPWLPLDPALSTACREARLHAHFAAQVAAAVGTTHLEPRPGDRHTSLRWSSEAGGVLVGKAVQGWRMALRVADLTWLLLDPDGALHGELSAHGRTVAAGLAWAKDLLSERGVPPQRLARDDYDLPDHPAAHGAPLSAEDAPGLRFLADAFANADALVRDIVRSDHSHATPPRVWPHHFDLASTVLLDPDGDPTTDPQVTVGMSPGDAGIPTPYLYVTAWPMPDSPALPELPRGRWAASGEGLSGALLPLADLGPPDDQAAVAVAFTRAATKAALGLAGA